MPKILEIIKKYKDHESAEFVKELTAVVEEVYNTGMTNGSNFVAQRMIEFIQTGK